MGDLPPAGGFWNVCWHPRDQLMHSPDDPAITLCGKCGAALEGLTINTLRRAAEAMLGRPMPELGVDMTSLEEKERD